MNLYVLLSAADQQALGCGERLAVDLMEVTAREQATLQQAFGWHTLEDLHEAIGAMLRTDGDGRTTIRRDPNVYLALTWLALRRAGLLTGRRSEEMAVELADLDIRFAHAQLDFDRPDPQGKGDGSTPTATSTS